MSAFGLFDVQARPNRVLAQALSFVVFLVCLGLYVHTSQTRHKENPEDRIVPNAAQLKAGVHASVLEPAEEDDYIAPDNASTWQRFRHSMLWKDTVSSSRRFAISLLLLMPAILFALHIGLFPYVHAGGMRFILFFDKIVALSLLPILFIAFGIDEWSKIALIVIGVAPTLMLDVIGMVRGVPQEQVVKAFTLGANDFDVAYRVTLKQILPQIINSLRLSLKPIMLFLFAGEMIAASDGLAYRIAIMRRHMGMDVILPYVLWVALLLFLHRSLPKNPEQEDASMVSVLDDVSPDLTQLLNPACRRGFANCHPHRRLSPSPIRSGRGTRKTILEHARSSKSRKGEFVVLLGQTGCGKSTSAAHDPRPGTALPPAGVLYRVRSRSPSRKLPPAAATSPRNTRSSRTAPCSAISPSVRKPRSFHIFGRLQAPPSAKSSTVEIRSRSHAPAWASWAFTPPTPLSTRTSSPAACSSASLSPRR